MKKWILMLTSLGYLNPAFATSHDSFLVTGEALQEVSNYEHAFDVPNFFTRVFPQNINPNLVIVPRTNSGFMFGVIGMLARSFDNQTDFAIPDSTPLAFTPSPTSVIRSLTPDYNFGYGAFAGYVYPYTGRDIELEFMKYDTKTNDSIGAPVDGTLWTPLALYDQTVEAVGAQARYETSVLTARLMMGQTIFAGTRLRLRPSLGLGYANINRTLSTDYNGASGILSGIFGNSSVQQKSNFSGIGPGVQLDATYFLGPHFGIRSHLLTSILVGNIDSSDKYTEDLLFPGPDASPHNVPGNTEISLRNSYRTVVNMDGKLGALFEYPICGSNSKFDIEIGYQFNHFFNALDTYRSAGGAILPFEHLPDFIDTPLHIKQPHDLTIDGPYLNIGLSGVACPNNVVIDPVCVTVPRLDGGFVFGLGAAYYVLQNNQRDYALLDPSPVNTDPTFIPALVVPGLNSTLKSVNSKNSYGLMVDLGYVFRDTPYDLTFHGEGLNANDSTITKAPATGVVWPILVTPFFTTDQTGIFSTQADASLKFSYYELHVDFGQAISAGDLAWFRLFEGVEYARLQSKLKTKYHNVNSPSFAFASDEEVNVFYPEIDVLQQSNFAGYGPRFGLDMALPMGGFNLISEIAGGFLFGNIDAYNKENYQDGVLNPPTDSATLIVPAGAIGTNLDSEDAISPFLDLKIGIGYGFNLFSRTKWNVEIGYKAAHYFNAATDFRHLTNNAAVFAKQVDDVTIDGPYLNVSVYGFGTCPPDCKPHDPYCVIVPELKGGLEAAIEYIYARPQVTNLDYAITDAFPTFVPNSIDPLSELATNFEFNPSDRSKVRELVPQYESGYRVHFGYIFPLTSNDISINYGDLTASSTTHSFAPPSGFLWTISNGSIGTVSDIDTTAFPVAAERADISADFRWQTGNIEFGKRVKFYNLMMRVFAGLGYAKVGENITITYEDGFVNSSDPIPATVALDTLFQGNDFSGFGPRLGLAADLGFGCGFSLVGLVGTDLLVGTFNSDFTEISSSGDTATLNPTKRTRLAPAIDAKLGLAYTIPLKNCAQISIEAGYQLNQYFNASDTLRFSSNSNAFVKEEQDVSFDGLYGRLQIAL
jgi:hypothetical protein